MAESKSQNYETLAIEAVTEVVKTGVASGRKPGGESQKGTSALSKFFPYSPASRKGSYLLDSGHPGRPLGTLPAGPGVPRTVIRLPLVWVQNWSWRPAEIA